MTIKTIDTRGLRCPWPALRLARALRETEAGAEIRLVTDDPKAESEIKNLVRANKWRIKLQKNADNCIFIVTR
jgi:tRNA 2-thiouridine synthesizing protein A